MRDIQPSAKLTMVMPNWQALLDEWESRPKVVITGSRKATPADAKVIRQDLVLFPKRCILLAGACVGVDALAIRLAYQMGIHVHCVLPGVEHNHRWFDYEFLDHCHTWQQLPFDHDFGRAMRARDQFMVDKAHILYGYPERDEKMSLRSGSWMTIRMGRKRGIPTHVRILEDNR